ncbi:23S rRNA (cytidine(2498)-2'-O)-methyltransferase RlmM [Luteimonas pelagia]
MAPALLFYCRAGFEPDLAAELVERSAAAGEPGHARAERGSGHVLFSPADPSRTDALDRALPFASLVFARQKLRVVAELRELPPRDRISPLLAALEAAPGLPDRFGQLWTEHPDADQARPLAGLARSFGNAFRPALRRAGHLAARDEPRAPRLHACFLAGDHVLLATSRPDDGAPWLMGIPRLRLHADAPSRSALKLEEALLVLLDDRARASLAPGMHAADLGAAPGGWTWVLVRHHLRVAAIDNGPMQPALMDSGLVEHLRADGFTWQPPRPLDWMVCDMVEQPRRVAARMADWLRNGWCRRTVFNLKLPMRKRWQETRDCLAAFRDAAGGPVDVRARQLYHDREEVTVFARPAG